jgi:hypothetical protein
MNIVEKVMWGIGIIAFLSTLAVVIAIKSNKPKDD